MSDRHVPKLGYQMKRQHAARQMELPGGDRAIATTRFFIR